MSREINLIVIHCSATREDRDYTPEQLDKDHRERGFRCAGYHYYVRKDGKTIPMRPLADIPAHARGYNAQSIAICYEGGLDRNGQTADTRTPEQKESLALLVWQLTESLSDCYICGHRDLSTDLNGDGVISPYEWIKECPCFDAAAEYAPFLKDR